MDNSLIGLADCNNFFCSCERVFHPDLRDKPVVVLSNNDGCIVARSNESKALGLKMGDVFYQVKDMLIANNVAVFSSNYNLYGDMSRRVMSLLSKYAPSIEVYSIDEAFLDFAGMEGGQALVEYCQEMVRFIHKGTGIPISVGLAPTKTLAKVASKFAKKYPGYKGVCIIDDDVKREKALRMFDIGDVWGVGRRYAKKMQSQGIATAWDFTQKSKDWVSRNYTVAGLHTWKELRGEKCIDSDALPHKKSICTSRSFPDKGINHLGDLEEAVANFAAACVRKLREQHCACAAMSVFAYTSRFRTDLPSDYIQTTINFATPTASLPEIVDAAIKALRSNWKGEEYFYKKAGALVWDITPDYATQLSLFDQRDRPKIIALQNAIDDINHKNGQNTVRTAVQGYSKKWHLKNEYLSRQYTTNIDDVIELKS